MNLTAEKIKAQVEIIRGQADIFLLDTAYLAKRSGVEYINGEAKETYSQLISFRCRLITRSGSETKNIAAQAREVQQSTFTELYRMQVPYSLDVAEGDHIFHDNIITGKRKQFEVLYAPQKHKYSGAVVLQLQEIK